MGLSAAGNDTTESLASVNNKSNKENVNLSVNPSFIVPSVGTFIDITLHNCTIAYKYVRIMY